MSAEKETLLRLEEGLYYLYAGLEPFLTRRNAPAHIKGTPLDTHQRLQNTSKLLKRMYDQWEGGFEKSFGSRVRYGARRITLSARECAEMAIDARHTKAHWYRGRLRDRDALRYLDAMLELLEAVNAPRRVIKEMKRLYDEQRSAGIADAPSILSVSRVKDPNSGDLYEIWLFHKSKFPDEDVADSYESFQRWVSNVDMKLLPEDHELNDIMLALKSSNQVVGYLYAQHYVKQKLIFISYIATDSTFRDAYHRGPTKLFDALVRICGTRSATWHAIVGEVEQVKGVARLRAEALFREFQYHARQLARVSKTPSKLFMIDFDDYLQPVIRPKDLDRDRTDEGIKQKLLYFARDIESLYKDAQGHYRLQPAEAINLFNTLLCCVYADAYPDHSRYQEYLRNQMESYTPKLREGLALIE